MTIKFELDESAFIQLQKDMGDAAEYVVDTIVDEADILGDRIVATAQTLVRVDTGATKRSLSHVAERDGPLVDFQAGSLLEVPERNTEQRILVAAINEFVHQPYMGPAFDQHYPRFEAAVGNLLEQSLVDRRFRNQLRRRRNDV